MNKLIISFIMIFVFIGCEEPGDTQFASLSGASDFQESLSDVVNSEEKSEEKIGRRKNKKGKKVEIEVGGKDLQPEKPSKVVLEVAVYKEETAAKAEVASKEKADILFYVGGETNSCLQGLAKEVEKKGFLSHLDALDWKVAVSLFPKNPGFTTLENNGRKMTKNTSKLKRKFLLPVGKISWEDVSVIERSKMKVKKGEKLFLDTIQTEELDHGRNPQPRYDATEVYAYNLRNELPVVDFMDGLDGLLSNKKFLREDSKVHVVVIDYEHFPYYTDREWKKFYKKYPNLNIILVSSRRVSVSNFSYLSKSKKLNFEWVPKCNRDGISDSLIEALLK